MAQWIWRLNDLLKGLGCENGVGWLGLQNKESMIPGTNEQQVSSNDTVSRSAFKVTLGGLISSIVGFGFQLALASLFGAGVDMDAFLTAMVVPLYLQAVLIF